MGFYLMIIKYVFPDMIWTACGKTKIKIRKTVKKITSGKDYETYRPCT